MLRRRVLTGLLLGGAMSAVLGMAAALPASATTFVRIENFGNGLCLEPSGEVPQAGASILQEPCSSNAGQIWEPINISGNDYEFMNENTGLCLDARGDATNGTRVEQWPCDGISNEVWNSRVGNSLATPIISRVSGTSSHCLDVPGASMQVGATMQIYGCNGTVAQAWYVR